MKMTFSARLYIGFSLAILACAVSGITSYSILQKQQNQRVWVKEARRILDTTVRIQSQLIDMETGQRGFRATNEKRFLEPYYNGAKCIVPATSELKKLLSGNPQLSGKELE